MSEGMYMPTITPLPSPPSTSDPANFSSKADAHILAQHTWTDQVNAFSADLAGAGIVTPTRDSVAVNATTTNLWSNSKIQDWTGTATVTDFPDAPSAGSQRVAYPAAGTIITDNANIDVQGNVSYTVAAGDELTITAITVSTFYVTIQRKDGLPVIPPQSVLAGTGIDWYGNTAPTGYLACPLSQTYINATTYSGLAFAIGVNFGNGGTTVNAGSFVTGNTYVIKTVGTTDFTLIGATSNTVGLTFKATGAGAGTGVANDQIGLPFYPADYASVQANANVGTSHIGEVISHTHTSDAIKAPPNTGTNYLGAGTPFSATGATIAATGGASNRAAGVRVLKCIKY